MRPARPVATLAGRAIVAMHQRKLGVWISRKLGRKIAVAQGTGIIADKVGGMNYFRLYRRAGGSLPVSSGLREQRLIERKQDYEARDSIEPTSHLAHRWNILHYAGVRLDTRRMQPVRLSGIAHDGAEVSRRVKGRENLAGGHEICP